MGFSDKFLKKLERLASRFIHLHVHDEYSNIRLKDSTNKLDKMVDYVSTKLNQNGMAITNHECLSSSVKYIQLVKRLKESGKLDKSFKPIIGNEIYLTSKELMEYQRENGFIKFYHFILLAKNEVGHRQLREISSIAWKNNYFNYKGMDRVPTFYADIENVIGSNKGNLIATTACVGGFLGQNVMRLLGEEELSETEENTIKDDILDFFDWCEDIFGKENFYIEMQPSDQEEMEEVNKYMLKIAKHCDLNWIFTCDAHYLNKEERLIHKAFLMSDDDEDSGAREVDSFYGTTYFMDVFELANYLSYLDEDDILKGIENTGLIANKVEEYDLQHPQIIPVIPLPSEDTWYHNEILYKNAKKYPHIKEMIESKEINDRYLASLTLEGFANKTLKNTVNNLTIKDKLKHLERVDAEFKEILDGSKIKGEPVSSYFIVEVKNINIIWEEAESIVGTSRGSAAGFITNYYLGITQINPLEHNQGLEMPLWRFITGDRLKYDFPDIDIDIPSHKADRAYQCLERYYSGLGGSIAKVGTFGTETAKSAIQTACRGLGINNDIGLYLSSLIPVERGNVRDIKTCYYGNEQLEIDPIYEFRNTIDEHDNLLQVALGVEGLVNKRSVHPCGIIPMMYKEYEHNAVMRAPNGEIVTQFDLGDCEHLGGVKYDLLKTKACAMIQVCLELLLEHGEIEWQGNLRKTYDRYLHPDVLETHDVDMWAKVKDLVGAFQYDSNVGKQALHMVNPTNLIEATAGNNLMRLMVEGEGKEQPLDMYVRYKNDINEWYQDMKEYGLNEDEIEILKDHLQIDYGTCSTQESMMLMVMDKRISNFNVTESNLMRKSVAKKKKKLIEEAKALFFKKGHDIGSRKELLDYIWFVQIGLQLGYSFSVLHSVGYSYILIQQLNLVHFYSPIYWNTAFLLVESGSLEQEQLEKEDIGKEKTTNYGTVAKAIGALQQQNIKIALPNINKAMLGFVPDVENEEIIFGMKGIMGINNETSKLIMENRPYSSLQDFYERMVLVKREVELSTGKKQQKSLVSASQAITLIKAGAFDAVECNTTREKLLENFLLMLNPPKKSITGKQIENVIQLGIIPSDMKLEVRFYRFRNYILDQNCTQDKDTKGIKWYTIDEDYAVKFFNEHFAVDMEEGKDYKYNEYGDLVVAMGTKRKGSFENLYIQKISPMTKWLNSKECLELYNELLFEDVKGENMSGSKSTWEMESMNFYYHKHELSHVDNERYGIEDFNTLSEEPEVVGYTKYAGKNYPKFKLTKIIGTVLDRDKNKHTVTLLTPTDVVTVKFYQGQFAFYDKAISYYDDNLGKKVTVEKSWFTRGDKLLITGFRRGDQFKPKRYKNSIYQHSVCRVLGIDSSGVLEMQSERANV